MKLIYQKGMATLLFSVIILLVVSFVTLYTSKSIITETNITNNEVRSQKAFEAAQAGVDFALSRLKNKKRPTPVDPNGFFDADTDYDDGNPDVTRIFNYQTINNSSSSLISSAEITVECIVCSIGEYKYRVISQGFSDDKSSSRTITVALENNPSIDEVPENPLITKGTIVLKGSAMVYNQEGASTIWSGGAIDFSKVVTTIASPSDPDYPECLDTSFSCLGVNASNNDQGIDVIPNDSTLAAYDANQLFLNFFGESYENFKSRPSSDVTKYSDPSKSSYDKGDIYPSSGTLFKETIWVDGDLSLNGGLYGCDAVEENDVADASFRTDGQTECDLGGTLAPVIMVVDGDLDLAGGAQIYGLVFVFGDINFKGQADVIGAVIADGEISGDAGGNPNIWFNSNVIQKGNDSGAFATVSGGWRDF
jgi:hypothetical protein